MRLVFLTDIHGAIDRVSTLLSQTVADVYIVGGDLIDLPFYSMENAIRYHELHCYFDGLRGQMGKHGEVMEDFVDSLLERPDLSADIESRGTTYQHLSIRARRVMQQKYKVLENYLRLKPRATILCLPGNYDMDLKYTALHERDLHMHQYRVKNLTLAGYGGAEVWTAGIPERYVVKYHAGSGIDLKHSEMFTYFRAVKPDIIVAHQPPLGIHDNLLSRGASGSAILRSFCDTHDVLLCLTGHVHNDWGATLADSTVFLNPSNFGDVTGVTGEITEGGFFYVIEIEGRRVKRIQLKKLVEGRIYDLAEYVVRGGRLSMTIVDEPRYESRVKGNNFDLDLGKYTHIPEIELHNSIKQFFRRFQTAETDDRIDKLEATVREIQQHIQSAVAMDIVGSVNMGLSESGSDIDIILYVRCGHECNIEMGGCPYHQQTQKMLREVTGDKYALEIIDCIDLDRVERSINELDYECEVTQRFVAYRSVGTPINYPVIAPVEDMLNRKIEFRRELEGSVRSYFQIFAGTSQNARSFEKYEQRLRSIGIHLPRSVRQKVQRYLSGRSQRG